MMSDTFNENPARKAPAAVECNDRDPTVTEGRHTLPEGADPATVVAGAASLDKQSKDDASDPVLEHLRGIASCSSVQEVVPGVYWIKIPNDSLVPTDAALPARDATSLVPTDAALPASEATSLVPTDAHADLRDLPDLHGHPGRHHVCPVQISILRPVP
jgi:hypothetical protein